MALWKGRASPAQAVEAAESLQQSLGDGRKIAVFVENVADFIGSPADTALQSLIKLAISDEQFVVIEGESSGLSGSMGLLGLAKSSRTGLALAPDQGDGALFRATFPRMNANERLPGRGLYVRAGRAEVVQVAMTPDE
jgi:S-DNA-T family DNA segregation ATPase FtsK/SpoIIIE